MLITIYLIKFFIHYFFYQLIAFYLQILLAPKGWCSLGKCIPLLGWHCKTPTLSGTKFAEPHPYWHKIKNPTV